MSKPNNNIMRVPISDTHSLNEKAAEDLVHYLEEEQQEEAAELRREKINKKVKIIGRRALIIAFIILLAKGWHWVDTKHPKVPRNSDDDEGTHDTSIDETYKKEVDNKVKEYSDEVSSILVNTKGGFSMQNDGTVDKFKEYLRGATDSELNYRLHVYAAYRAAGLGDFPILFNSVAKDLSSHDGENRLLGANDLTEYLRILGYNNITQYCEKERDALARLLQATELSDTERKVFEAVISDGGRSR